MVALSINPRYIIVGPSARLREYVSHYWLSLDNPDMTHIAVPDGAVDLVIRISDASMDSWIYGSTTGRTEIGLHLRCHYIGIRFQPGQSRHFIKAAARELTDNHADAKGLLRLSLNGIHGALLSGDVINYLNRHLEKHLAGWQPVGSRIDESIDLIVSGHGNVRINDLAACYGRSLRQFERVFLQTVGVSPKFFSLITRYRHTAALITTASGLSLADAAAVIGYADQSHMNHDFKRMTGLSPSQFIKDVAILQDWDLRTPETERSSQSKLGGML